MSSRQLTLKRGIDIVVSALGLVILGPLLIVIGCLVRRTMGAPILFRQVRPGLNGAPFIIRKFRTMRDVFDANGQPVPNSERLTNVGRLLRKSSLDEIPELWNVLRGDMSLVGPRPLLMEYLDLYTPEQARRHNVRPGITGWAQVNGRNAISWEEKFAYDVWYVDNWSLWLDFRILCLTAPRVVKRQGIQSSADVLMPKFAGSPTEQNMARTVHE